MPNTVKSGFFHVTYPIQVDGLDNNLGEALVTIADFDRMAAQASTVSQDPDTGIITMTGTGISITLNPDNHHVEIVRTIGD